MNVTYVPGLAPVGRDPVLSLAQVSSGSMTIAPLGHSATHRPQPLQ